MLKFFYSGVLKTHLFLYIGEKIGCGRGAASVHTWISCLNFNFPREHFWIPFSVVMIYVSISQLSCIGSSLGRQNSCCFGLPGCKLKRLLILYLWGMLAADLNARNPYLYWLVKSTTSILHRNLFKAPAASMPAWLFHFPVLIRGKEWRLWHEWVTRLASCPRTFT